MSPADLLALVPRLIDQAIADHGEGNADVVIELTEAKRCLSPTWAGAPCAVDLPQAVAYLQRAQQLAAGAAARLTKGARRELRQVQADCNRVMLRDTIGAALGLLTAGQAQADAERQALAAARRASAVVFQELAQLAHVLHGGMVQAGREEVTHLTALVAQIGCVADAAALSYGGTMARGLSREWLMTPAAREALRMVRHDLQEGGAA
jgi:hypothetical protein